MRLDLFRVAALSTSVFPNESRLEAKGNYVGGRESNSSLTINLTSFDLVKSTLCLKVTSLEPLNSGR